MYIELVTDFIAFLGNRRHTHDEVLAHLTLRTFASLGCTSTFLMELKPNSHIELAAKYSSSADFFDEQRARFRLTDATPIAEAVMLDEIVWINTLPDWDGHYPALDGDPFEMSEQTFICWPVSQSGTPCAVMGIFCQGVVDESDELKAFFRAIGNLVALYFYDPQEEFNSFRELSRKRALNNGNNHDTNLSERQLLILRLIAEGRTNMSISDALGYSESTIRQETIKIYAKLQCMGRHEAARIYRDNYAQASVS